MTKVKEVYRCAICGNIVEIMHMAGGTLTCCGQPMELLTENTVDAAKEKHVPVVEAIEGGYKVKVGSVEHPMQDNHYIEWIELVEENKIQRVHLNRETNRKLFSTQIARMFTHANIVIYTVIGAQKKLNKHFMLFL